MRWRRLLLIVAALVGAVTLLPTAASARGGFRGGRGFGGAAVGLGLGLGLAGAGYYGGYYGGYPAYGGCWRRQVVYTPYGPRARRVWVCG